MRYYLFQLSEDTVAEVLAHLESGGDLLSLPFRNHRHEAGPGDQVLLWVQGRDAFAWGAGQIDGPEALAHHPMSYREPDRGNGPRPAFPVRFDGFLDRNVHRSELKEQPAFAEFPFDQANVRNPFELSEDQYNAIFDRAESDA
ncbi:EVE domain-containing protein [Nocardioides allogilvus]|uniref:hypothetical protein n=1 Tax=Nocardioides allogilvus TaxID=2072017 RepID=UPI000D2F4EE6|nr:hypothetical protein [Nocardioides allogilvus]